MDEAIKKAGRLSALEKALTILEIITDQPQSIGLPDLTSRTGLPRQTLHRLLKQLEAEGLIVRDPSRVRFSIGPRLARLSMNALLSTNQDAPVRTILQSLVEDIHETCNLGVLDGMEFMYLERIETDWALRVSLQAGSRVPAHSSAGGKMLLANLPGPLRKRLLKAAPLNAFTKFTITDPGQLEEHLQGIRELGYSLNNQETTIGIIGVAVPVLDQSGKSLAALACHAPSARVSPEEIIGHVHRLRQAAKDMAPVWDDPIDANL